MTTKRINPYERLRQEFAEYANKVEHAHTRMMWRYPKDNLRDSQWCLSDLNERVVAAEQLGYDVILKSTDAGLDVFYRKKAPGRPWSIR